MYTNNIKEFKGNGKVKMEQLEVKKLSINNSVIDLVPKAFTFTSNQNTAGGLPGLISISYTIVGTTVLGSIFFDNQLQFPFSGNNLQIKNLNIANRLPIEIRPVKESQVAIVVTLIGVNTTSASANLIISPTGDFRIASGESSNDDFPLSVASPGSIAAIGTAAKSGFLYSLL